MSMLRDFSDADLPPLRGYVVTTAKERVEQVLAGPENDPLLVTWRCGLGQSVAWTSDASAWAQDWAATLALPAGQWILWSSHSPQRPAPS